MSDAASSSCAFVNLSKFAFKLLSILSKTANDDNILVSPFSIASSLALATAGATSGSKCQKELHEVLGIQKHDDIPMLSNALLSTANNKSGVTIMNANGIWSKSLKQSFISMVENVHDAVANDMPATYAPIDAFITQKTEGMIQNMLSGDIDPLTVAVLVNAVFFKGSWRNKFDEANTYDGTFTNLNGNEKSVKYMYTEREMQFAEEVDALNGASVVKLDYGNEDEEEMDDHDAQFSALFILPEKEGTNGMTEVIEKLSSLHSKGSNGIQMILDGVGFPRKAKLHLPRFKMEYGTKSLVSELKQLGLVTCFDKNEGFKEMSDDPLVYLDDVLHKVVVEVTEEGTKAAAATAAIMMTRSLPRPSPVITFDRPFVMLIIHLQTQTPLFVARCSRFD